MSVFFFQAEDGIRDFHVTGVQTCALPISGGRAFPLASRSRVEGKLRSHSSSNRGGGRSAIVLHPAVQDSNRLNAANSEWDHRPSQDGAGSQYFAADRRIFHSRT